jgi:hypothetical protein
MSEERDKTGYGPRGIAGWLYVFAGVIAAAPFFVAWRALRNAQSAVAIMGTDEPWRSAFWILLEFVVTMIVLAGSLIVAWLFFSKKKALPQAFVWFTMAALLASGVSFVTGAVLLASEIDSNVLPFELVNWRAPIAGALWAVISIPYMMKSRRVRNTFIN